jgi:hypothetical protein
MSAAPTQVTIAHQRRAIFEPATPRQLETARKILALTIGVYLALGPFGRLGGQPAALFRPVLPLRLLGVNTMPPTAWMLGLQLVGLVAVGFALTRRWARPGFGIVWIAFFVLCAFESSLGKYLHNDVVLLLASAPLLAAPRVPSGTAPTSAHRWGWPLSSGLIVLVFSYWFAGLSKVANSGAGWVFSDNIRYVMADAAASGHPWWPQIASFVSTQPFLSYLTGAYILGLELSLPVVLFLRNLRPWFAAAVVYLHVATFLTLGLDYWSWAITACVLLLRPEFRRPEFRRPEFRRPEFRRPEFRRPEFRRPEFRRPEFRRRVSSA